MEELLYGLGFWPDWESVLELWSGLRLSGDKRNGWQKWLAPVLEQVGLGSRGYEECIDLIVPETE